LITLRAISGPTLLALLAFAWLFAGAGCGGGLFADDNATVKSRLRYYGDDSASETSANRKRASDMQFGMPGFGQQQE
jgi:hypothetical protein